MTAVVYVAEVMDVTAETWDVHGVYGELFVAMAACVRDAAAAGISIQRWVEILPLDGKQVVESRPAGQACYRIERHEVVCPVRNSGHPDVAAEAGPRCGDRSLCDCHGCDVEAGHEGSHRSRSGMAWAPSGEAR